MTPPTPKDADIAGVAARLTKAQREALLAFKCRGVRYFTHNRRDIGRCLRPDLAHTWGVSSWRLTPLGLAVRALIQPKEDLPGE